MSKPSYYAVIPAHVRYDNNLSAMERLLYAEITCLTNMTGECWAKNKYFAELFDRDIRSIKRMLSSLRDNGYIKVYVERNQETKEVIKRLIKLTDVREANTSGHLHDSNDKNVLGGQDKNVPYNNKIGNSNIYINNSNIKTTENKGSDSHKSCYSAKAEKNTPTEKPIHRTKLTDNDRTLVKNLVSSLVDKKKISDPKETTSEIEFSLTSLKGFSHLEIKHALNCVKVLIEQNKWRRPVGYQKKQQLLAKDTVFTTDKPKRNPIENYPPEVKDLLKEIEAHKKVLSEEHRHA